MRSAPHPRTNTRMLVLSALFTALTAAGAFLKFPLGAMPVTLQFLFTALAGILLGPKWGAVSQAVYVAVGLVGLPVFTMGGGPGYIFQPSFGFLLGQILAALAAGAVARNRAGRLPWALLAGAAALGVLYLVGLPYIYLIFNAYMGKEMTFFAVVKAGMLVYLPGDAVKLALIALSAGPLTRALSRAQA